MRKEEFTIIDKYVGKSINEVLDKIKTEINKLSPEPTAEDVIDGNEVKDAIWENLIEVNKIINKYRRDKNIKEQEPRHWIKDAPPCFEKQYYKCTACGYYINFGRFTKEFKYCPNCGAKLVKDSQGFSQGFSQGKRGMI